MDRVGSNAAQQNSQARSDDLSSPHNRSPMMNGRDRRPSHKPDIVHFKTVLRHTNNDTNDSDSFDGRNSGRTTPSINQADASSTSSNIDQDKFVLQQARKNLYELKISGESSESKYNTLSIAHEALIEDYEGSLARQDHLEHELRERAKLQNIQKADIKDLKDKIAKINGEKQSTEENYKDNYDELLRKHKEMEGRYDQLQRSSVNSLDSGIIQRLANLDQLQRENEEYKQKNMALEKQIDDYGQVVSNALLFQEGSIDLYYQYMILNGWFGEELVQPIELEKNGSRTSYAPGSAAGLSRNNSGRRHQRDDLAKVLGDDVSSEKTASTTSVHSERRQTAIESSRSSGHGEPRDKSDGSSETIRRPHTPREKRSSIKSLPKPNSTSRPQSSKTISTGSGRTILSHENVHKLSSPIREGSKQSVRSSHRNSDDKSSPKMTPPIPDHSGNEERLNRSDDKAKDPALSSDSFAFTHRSNGPSRSSSTPYMEEMHSNNSNIAPTPRVSFIGIVSNESTGQQPGLRGHEHDSGLSTLEQETSSGQGSRADSVRASDSSVQLESAEDPVILYTSRLPEIARKELDEWTLRHLRSMVQVMDLAKPDRALDEPERSAGSSRTEASPREKPLLRDHERSSTSVQKTESSLHNGSDGGDPPRPSSEQRSSSHRQSRYSRPSSLSSTISNAAHDEHQRNGVNGLRILLQQWFTKILRLLSRVWNNIRQLSWNVVPEFPITRLFGYATEMFLEMAVAPFDTLVTPLVTWASTAISEAAATVTSQVKRLVRVSSGQCIQLLGIACCFYYIFLIFSNDQNWYTANTSTIRDKVMSWREEHWEFKGLQYLRWHLELAIMRQSGSGEFLIMT